MSHLRQLGKRSLTYIIELLNLHQEELVCAQQEQFIHKKNFTGGWFFKTEKSSGPPCLHVRHLGIIIYSVTASLLGKLQLIF